jgi:hypothetical protein
MELAGCARLEPLNLATCDQKISHSARDKIKRHRYTYSP